MSHHRRNGSGPASMPIRLVPATLVAAALLAAPAFAQTPLPKSKAPSSPAQTVAPAAIVPQPTFDEGTTLRIAAAMLSYSAIEVRGGWPTLPANARLAPGVSGPEVSVAVACQLQIPKPEALLIKVITAFPPGRLLSITVVVAGQPFASVTLIV